MLVVRCDLHNKHSVELDEMLAVMSFSSSAILKAGFWCLAVRLGVQNTCFQASNFLQMVSRLVGSTLLLSMVAPFGGHIGV